MTIMQLFRKTKLVPILAMLLAAAVVVAQAAGCCKTSDLYWALWQPGQLSSISSQVEPAKSLPGHAHCCPSSKPGRESAGQEDPPITDCLVPGGCCLQNAEPNQAKIPQPVFQLPAFPVFIAYFLPALPSPGDGNIRFEDAKPIPHGPPLFLSQRRLLL